jgi:hypothetical protein
MGGFAWTPEDMIVAGCDFLARSHHLPKTVELRAAEGLPSFPTVKATFGSLDAYRRQIVLSARGAFLVRDLAASADVRRPVQRRPVAKRACLRCDKRFLSHGIGNRICPACAGETAWQEAGQSLRVHRLGTRRVG